MAIKVFFNNSCSVCRLEINHYKKISDNNLEWVDVTNNQEAINLTSKSSAELLRRLHVIENGEVIVIENDKLKSLSFSKLKIMFINNFTINFLV